MLFNSLHFLIFFPFVTAIYFVLPHRYRWVLLLAASYYFYMVWRPIYALLIVGSTLVDYYATIWMEHSDSERNRRLYLFLSLFTNLGILFAFKYLGFFTEVINGFTQNDFDVIYLILPMGISFYTFQTLSYTIDVYRREREAEKHLGYFALYVTFFPQLVAGPIERSSRLLPQLKKKYDFDYQRTVEGLQRMTWGFFKKVVIADNLAIAVNHVYGNVEEMSGLTLLVATGFFAYQIYCDFSGYSDIAIGSARILGIDLMENFKRPYFSTSIREFWSRWHISLSTWFRDYVYIPLGGSKKGPIRTYVNILLVFLISGLWHGASWMFIIWGGIHGVYSLYERVTEKYRVRLWKSLKLDGTRFQWSVQWSITMAIALFSWIFFRANELNSAIVIINTVLDSLLDLSVIESFRDAILSQSLNLGIGPFRLLILVISIIILEIIQIFQESYQDKAMKIWSREIYRFGLMQMLIIWILLFGQFGLQEFIYFQF